MGNLNYIVFGGVDSRDYGIYISGEGVFNAPERDVEVVNIPGKDGDLLIDRGRFLNIQVTYPGFNFEPDLSTFAERLRAFRAALASQIGYQRLEDSFHPDEFRLASFRGGLDIKTVMYNTASTFDIVFDCKPQRFLKSGEEEIVLGEWGETETITGEIATFEGTDTTAIKSLVAQIEPKQEGSGDPSPTNVRPISGWDSVKTNTIGKNLFKNRLASKTKNGITITVNADGSMNLNGTCTGWFFENLNYVDANTSFLPEGNYIFSGGATGCSFMVYADGTRKTTILSNAETPFSMPKNNASWVRFEVNNGAVLNNVNVYPMIRVSTDTDPTYEPYQGETITKSLGQTVYGGTLDLVSGALTVYPFYSSYNGQTLSGKWICDRAVYSEGTTPPNGSQVVDMSGNGTEYQLTPEQIETLLGVNNIWADSGEVSVEIGEDPNILVNPTPFEALPLFEVVGTGSLTVGNTTIGITGDSTQDIFIDSDIMEAYEDDNGAIISRNDRINLSGTDFPKLGEETRVESNGLTSVKITPRWWTI